MKALFTFTIALAILLTGCKEFIEPSIEKRNVVLLAPTNGAESSRYSQTFWWEPVEDALKYRLQVVSPNFDQTLTLILDTLLETNRFNYTLDPGNYEWRVRGENGSSQTHYFKSSFFIYASSIKEQQVQLQLPGNNTLTNQAAHTFTWLKLFGADKYILQIDTNNFIDESKLFLDKTLPGQEFAVTFERDKLYKWRVKAKNDTAESKWSVIQNITYDKTPPAIVLLNAPANNELVAKPVNLRWNATATATKYQLYAYKSEGRVLYSSKFPMTLTATNYSFTEGVSGEKVYWEVRAIDEAGNTGAYSELRSFVIQ
ncbi:hypothetical protein [Pedobacter hiemivivus]|uniref:Fibronectin type-III domain-containing protein n=1 Tax=Pedobacter hiemivivus TaxID=2530454 RepID=A0A4R0NBJ9_9SPHI|nr:hypothetical protein [Pedobacter hiemivivus]TCC97681.1 hypothetical protein EZ444_07125 [Pedobacter hiemivivus]